MQGIPRKQKGRFQHTAARRRLLVLKIKPIAPVLFQHTAARRRLHRCELCQSSRLRVSTHSRAEAAATADELKEQGLMFQHTAARRRLP